MIDSSPFFFTATATTEIYTLSLHDALPIFQTGDKVIYPNHGLGIVERIEEKTILGTTCGFFHLRIVSNDTTVLVPDRKSTRLNSSHSQISYAVFCLKKKKQN